MAQRLKELCNILIENAFGDLAAQIFTVLADYGRSTIMALHQFTHIPLRQIKTAIATLIQHHIILHHSVDEDSPTSFQIDWNTAYNLVRSHKVTSLVVQREGEAAGQLVATIQQLGQASVGDLLDAYELTEGSKRDSGIDTVEHHMSEEGLINGIAKDGKQKNTSETITTVSDSHSILRTLLEKGYLMKVAPRSYVPPRDLEEQLRDTVIEGNADFKDGKVNGSKKKLQFENAVNSLKRKCQDEDSYSKTRDVASRGTIKRSKAPTSSNKRVKLNGELPNGICHVSEIEDEEVAPSVQKLPNDFVVRVNVSKCTSILHTQRLERMAERHLGPVTAAVYSALLRSLSEPDVKPKPVDEKLKSDDHYDDCDDEEDVLPFAADTKVLENLDKSIDLVSGIKGALASHKLPNGVSNRHKPQVLSDDPDEADLGIKKEQASDNEDCDTTITSLKERNIRLHLLSLHLNLLAEHPKNFCTSKRNSTTTSVDIPALSQKIINTELDTIITARFGKISTRIVRILREKGKLDEKQLANLSMTRIIDLRALLTFLQFHGILDAQELPKDTSRQPSRTLYLWTWDEVSVRKRFVNRAYGAMSRCLQRVGLEKEGRFRGVIEKAARGDVKGREDVVLSWQERELLKEWREVEEGLLVQVGRLDGVVEVLRDFGEGVRGLTI